MFDRLCNLYKRIMKRDTKAVDEIKTLEDAKEIIKMIACNAYLTYQTYQDCLSECVNQVERFNKHQEDMVMRYNEMDYKAMWEELKLKIEGDLEYYEDGRMCSMMEAANGMLDCEIMLKKMKTLEEKYST